MTWSDMNLIWLEIRNRNFLTSYIVSCSVVCLHHQSVQPGRSSLDGPGRSVHLLRSSDSAIHNYDFNDYKFWGFLFYWFCMKLLSTSYDVGLLISLSFWLECMTSLVLKLAIWWNFGASGTTSLNKLFNLSPADWPKYFEVEKSFSNGSN